MKAKNKRLDPQQILSLGAQLFREYEKKEGPLEPYGRVDPFRMAEDVLDVHVEFVYFYGCNAPLGVASTTEGLGYPVLGKNGREELYFLDGRTVLVEKRRDRYGDSENAFRFTLMHETAHLVLERCQKTVLPGRIMERQANLFAACLLLPDKLLDYALLRFRFQPTPDSLRNPGARERERMKAIADYLGVSVTTLKIRLLSRCRKDGEKKMKERRQGKPYATDPTRG